MCATIGSGESRMILLLCFFHPKLEGHEVFVGVVSLTGLCSQSSQRNHGRPWEVSKHWTPAPSVFGTKSSDLTANMDEWIRTTAVFEEGVWQQLA